MNPLIIIAAGVGALLLFGKKKGQSALPPSAPPDVPLPPIPPILPDEDVEPEGMLGTDYSSAWADYPYQAEWYPAAARKQNVPPPSTWDGISFGEHCRTIAVGQGWWERAGEFVKMLMDGGMVEPRDLISAILDQYAGTCGKEETVAVRMFREEIADRLAEALAAGWPDVEPDPGPGPATPPPEPFGLGASPAMNGIYRGMRRAAVASRHGDTFAFGSARNLAGPMPRGRERYEGSKRNCPPSRYTLPVPGPPVGVQQGPHRNSVVAEPLKLGLIEDPMKDVNRAAGSRRLRPWRNRRLGKLALAPKRRVAVLRR